MDSYPPERRFPRRLIPLAALGTALLLGGCSPGDWPVLFPDGPIAFIERELLFTAVGLMLIVIVPVWLLALWVMLRYRAKDDDSNQAPDWQSGKVDAVVWAVPALIVIAIGTLVWDYTHRLDPYRELASSEQAIEVQAVAQDWKWLFIYPDQNVATVNELVFPVGRPVTFRITSDTVMNSFYIPGLAGQIFAMAGMQTQLNVVADKPSTFRGRNTQYSGTGFADQHFAVKAVSEAEFETWLGMVRESPDRLDAATYAEVAKPSEKAPVSYFASAEAGLFDKIIEKYMGPMAHGEMGQSN